MAESSEPCDHDFRRLYGSSLRGAEPQPGEPCLFVVCCRCGRSPISVLTDKGLHRIDVTGDWPVEELAITEYSVDVALGGASVEFVQRRRSSEPDS